MRNQDTDDIAGEFDGAGGDSPRFKRGVPPMSYFYHMQKPVTITPDQEAIFRSFDIALKHHRHDLDTATMAAHRIYLAATGHTVQRAGSSLWFKPVAGDAVK